MSKRIVLAVIAVSLALVAGWYWASPYFALRDLRDAARSGDVAALEERVDFPALRENFKRDLRARMASEMAAPEDGEGLGVFGAALGMAMIDPMIDGFLTSEFIGRAIRRGKVERTGDAERRDDAPDLDWDIARSGLDTFSATPDDEGLGNPPSLVFARDGLGWRLVAIHIPGPDNASGQSL
ncbi:DUF2939 domain-containing protein [Aurantiacibacter spongiae]|uniref:DUF2939 domain-containing protein n=1 Tax=Aurantiacibacter spongiae TaxID=2488860 RepID=A0A3N5CTG0_9SPHN|nr:DUF2939 domain-containing protein [Aurantiacibacter spongiae]RPF71967.1 DUF2939 domain-containing protein [Aurantiacibacter spongiae]